MAADQLKHYFEQQPNMEKGFLTAMLGAQLSFGVNENNQKKRIRWNIEPYCFWPDYWVKKACEYEQDPANNYEPLTSLSSLSSPPSLLPDEK